MVTFFYDFYFKINCLNLQQKLVFQQLVLLALESPQLLEQVLERVLVLVQLSF